MNLQQTASATASNRDNSIQDLFALSDEQILEIAPEGEGANSESRGASQEISTAAVRQEPATRPGDVTRTGAETATPGTSHDFAEPPAWLAAQMQDAWGGEEAREFWDGVQQARSEAAAYRASIATPEDARALKELYPGGVNEARTAHVARRSCSVSRNGGSGCQSLAGSYRGAAPHRQEPGVGGFGCAKRR